MVATRRLTRLADSVKSRSLRLGPDAVATVSGGADSAVSAWLVSEAGGRRALHVDHGLDGSPRLRRAAIGVAEAVGLSCRVIEVSPVGTSEGALREARYRALFGAVADGERLVLGHTSDDQAETVLMHLIRGSGSSGLAGMSPVQGRLVRPLLDVSRAETRELAELLGLPWMDDPANDDLRHFRNRVRLGLLPHIERSHAAGFSQTLVRTAALLRDDLAILESATDSVPVERGSSGFRVALGAIRAVEPAIAVRVVRGELTRRRSGVPPDRATVLRVMEVITGGVRSTQLPDRLIARIEGPFLVVAETGERPAVPEPESLVPGSIRWSHLRVDVSETTSPPPIPLSPWATVIPLGYEDAAPSVRTVTERDRVGPPGREVSVLRALASAGVDAGRRVTWPVVEHRGRIAWVPGVRRAGWSHDMADRYLCAVAVEESEWGPSER